MSGKLRTLVWKTGVLTITQHPLTNSCIFQGFAGVKTTMVSLARKCKRETTNGQEPTFSLPQ